MIRRAWGLLGLGAGRGARPVPTPLRPRPGAPSWGGAGRPASRHCPRRRWLHSKLIWGVRTISPRPRGELDTHHPATSSGVAPMVVAASAARSAGSAIASSSWRAIESMVWAKALTASIAPSSPHPAM